MRFDKTEIDENVILASPNYDYGKPKVVVNVNIKKVIKTYYQKPSARPDSPTGPISKSEILPPKPQRPTIYPPKPDRKQEKAESKEVIYEQYTYQKT